MTNILVWLILWIIYGTPSLHGDHNTWMIFLGAACAALLYDLFRLLLEFEVWR